MKDSPRCAGDAPRTIDRVRDVLRVRAGADALAYEPAASDPQRAVGTDLVEELVSRPDDVELRLVISDRLQDAGDPRGELMAVQCALAAAASGEDRERLRDREAALLAHVPAGLDPAELQLEWRLGFVLAATVLDRARAVVPALLAHPAARLIEELTIAAEPDELAEVGAALMARPRPSLLRRVEAGAPSANRRWVEVVEAAYVAPLAAAAPDLVVRPMAHVAQVAFEAEIEGDTAEHRSELWITQIAPPIEHGEYQVILPVRRGAEGALALARAAFSDWALRTLTYDHEAGHVCVYHASDRTYVGYANLYRALRTIAPFVEDTRFAISEDYSTSVDEYAIVRGELRFLRGFASDDNRDAKRDYWYERCRDRPCDDDLRRFVARLCAADAGFELSYVERLSPADADPDGHRDLAGRALERALSLDDRNPRIWQLRGRLARALGELDEAARCFAREQALDPARATSFDLALTMFAARQDAGAREHLERQLAAEPGHTGARLVAAFLAHRAADPDAARAHTETLASAFAAGRATAWLPEHLRAGIWPALEPHVEPIVQTGRHAELFAWCVLALAALDRGDAARIRGAAGFLLTWAEHFRLRAGHGRQPEESGRIAEILYGAAAELDPLDGDVHYHWSLFERRGIPLREQHRARRLGREHLERALAANPDHLGALVKLGALHRELGEPARAIELLEHCQVVARAARRPGGPRGMYWDLSAGELWRAYYEHAARLLFGVPPGVNRPPGRPAGDALVRADAALDAALALLRELSDRDREDHVACYLLKASIAAFRDQHRDALAWADRALALNDANPYAWSTRASCQNNLGALDDAATCAALAIELDAAHWHGHYVLACVEAKRGGDPRAILTRLARALELWPEGRPEAAAEPDLASLRELPAFRALVGEAPGPG